MSKPGFFDTDRASKVLAEAKEEVRVLLIMAADGIDDLKLGERIEAIFIEAAATAGVNTVNFIAFIAFVCDQVGINQLLGRRQKAKAP